MLTDVVQHRDTTPRHHVPAGKKQFPGKGSQTSYPPCAKEIVEMFHDHGNKLGVPDMRKYMKTLVAEIFFEDKYSAVHKCRGIWKQKPSDWPDDIPFCDPNNAEHPGENQKKPSRKTLATMMKYLVYKFEESRRTVKKVDPVYKSEESLQPIIQMGEPAQKSLTGNIVMQPSDWQQQAQEEVFVKQEEDNFGVVSDFSDLLQFPSEVSNMPTMEIGEMGQAAQEENNVEKPFDLISLLDSEPEISVAPQNTNVYEEVGANQDVNFNAQTKNNVENMKIMLQSPIPVMQIYAPPQEPAPVKNEVLCPVSNSGHLVMSHTTAAFSGGESQGDDLAATFQFTGDTIYENIDPSQYSDLLKDVDPNLIFNSSHPMMEDFTQGFMENSNQVIMENSNQVVMENSNQIMMETINQVIMEDMMKMEEPMEETTTAVQEMSAPVIGIIPPHVLDFDAE